MKTKLLVPPEVFVEGRVFLFETGEGPNMLSATVRLVGWAGESAKAQILMLHAARGTFVAESYVNGDIIPVTRMECTYPCRLSEAMEIGQRVFTQGASGSIPYPAMKYAEALTQGQSETEARGMALNFGAFNDIAA